MMQTLPSCVSNEKILRAWGGHMHSDAHSSTVHCRRMLSQPNVTNKKGHNELWFVPQQNIKQQWE